MHRHGYQGRKFGRERDQREALIKSLADSLVRDESIETTIFKAKEVVPYVEKLITKAKKGDLHNRRQVISGLLTIESAHKLVDEIAPKLTARNSGHLRIERTRVRRGDNAQLARISFVDDLKLASEKPAKTGAKTKQHHDEDKKTDAAPKAVRRTSTAKSGKSATVVSKRTGTRGNR